MELVEHAEFWREQLNAARHEGRIVGVVPTMGALHRGHLSLIETARHAGADFLTLSIFVNPTQFDDPVDLARYPRQLDDDLEACRCAGVQSVFVPSVTEMRQQSAGTQVLPPPDLASRLEGAQRPGHFEGMATIVTKLLVLAGPCIAAFGKKDYQQLAIIRRLRDDLLIDARIEPGEIIRESSGLACSSRNARLSIEGRARARMLYEGLTRARRAHEEGVIDPKMLRSIVLEAVDDAFDIVEYIEVVRRHDLLEFGSSVNAAAVILAAVRLEGVRLIDNIELLPTTASVL